MSRPRAVSTTLRDPQTRPPDEDFESLRQKAIDRLGASAPDWTDHNLHDPGITLLEVLLWALSDLHYRTESQDFRGWAAWRAEWRGLSLAEGSRDRDGTAELLRDRKEEIREVVDAASSRAEAIQSVVDAFRDEGIRPDDSAEALVRAIREPRLHRATLQSSGPVKALLASGAEDQELRSRIRQILEEPALWPEEIDDLLLRTRIRQVAGILTREEEGIREVLRRATSLPDAFARLRERFPIAPRGELTEEELPTLLHADPTVPTNPETFEAHTGRSRVWPPHPLQMRTVEPCTDADYLRLLRAVPGVRRGWILEGVARGIGWDGRAQPEELPWRKGAVTLLVTPTEEAGGAGLLPREPWTNLTARQRRYLRQVLTATLEGEGGRSEISRPHQDWTERLGPQTPRRMLGDEVGAALLTTWEINVRGVLVLISSARDTTVLREARSRLSRFLSPDRLPPEGEIAPDGLSNDSARPDRESDDPLEGPWPWQREGWGVGAEGPPDPGGWSPGAPVEVPELVSLLSTIDGVAGVEGLEVRAGHAPDTSPWSDDLLEIGRFAAPIYLHRPDCLRVRIHREGACDV